MKNIRIYIFFLLFIFLKPLNISAINLLSSIKLNTVKDNFSQIEQIYNVHGELISQLQNQILDNQKDIDLLRGKIQEIQHKLLQVVKEQERILQKIDFIMKNIN